MTTTSLACVETTMTESDTEGTLTSRSHQCGNCTLCCKLPQIPSVSSPIDTYCTHCEPGVGCKVYNVRPEECREFWCMWAQMEHVGAEMRPDKSHIIFEKVANDIIFARLEKGHNLSPLVLGQLRAFNNEGFSVLIFRGNASICSLTKGHTEEHVRRIVGDSAKLYGRSD